MKRNVMPSSRPQRPEPLARHLVKLYLKKSFMSVVVFMLHGFGFFATPLASAQNDWWLFLYK